VELPSRIVNQLKVVMETASTDEGTLLWANQLRHPRRQARGEDLGHERKR
jgi:hypothetical protein